MNEVQEFNCNACHDDGGWEIYHPSTDALIGWRPCGKCPPRPLVFKVVSFWESTWKPSPAELATLPPF